MRGKLRGKILLHGRAIRFDQRQILTTFAQIKIRVQSCSRNSPVLTRGKDNEKLTRRQRYRRKSPQGQIRRLVGQAPVFQRKHFGGRIVQLDPIGKRTILVGQERRIIGHEFGDDRICMHAQRGSQK